MRRVLAHRDFRLLWLSQAGSVVGDRLTTVAIALYVNQIGTPTDVGLVLAATAVPFVALLLIGGVWADRLPRHLVMVVTDVIRGGLQALTAVLIFTHSARVWELAAIGALYGVAHAFFRPAYTGLVPQTVPEELLQEATSANMLTFNAGGIVGPALAAALVVTVGAGSAFAIDAATFFVSAALLIQVRPRDRGGAPVQRESMLTELRGGFREVRARPWVALVVGMASFHLLIAYGPYQALGPAVAGAVYGQPAIYGVTSAVRGVGSVAGSLISMRWKPVRMVFAGMICGLPWGLINVTFAAGIPLGPLLAFSLVAGAGSALFITYWETALAIHIPPRALGRVSSFDWMGSLGLYPIGLAIAGPVGEAIGARETLIVGGAVATLTGALVAFSPWVRQLKSGTPLSGVEASA